MLDRTVLVAIASAAVLVACELSDPVEEAELSLAVDGEYAGHARRVVDAAEAQGRAVRDVQDNLLEKRIAELTAENTAILSANRTLQRELEKLAGAIQEQGALRQKVLELENSALRQQLALSELGDRLALVEDENRLLRQEVALKDELIEALQAQIKLQGQVIELLGRGGAGPVAAPSPPKPPPLPCTKRVIHAQGGGTGQSSALTVARLSAVRQCQNLPGQCTGATAHGATRSYVKHSTINYWSAYGDFRCTTPTDGCQGYVVYASGGGTGSSGAVSDATSNAAKQCIAMPGNCERVTVEHRSSWEEHSTINYWKADIYARCR